MSSCQICQETKEILFCKTCNKLFCFACLKQFHENQTDLQKHLESVRYICDNCEKKESAVNCSFCEQNLCLECDVQFHNKGKRAEHIRTAIQNLEFQQTEQKENEFYSSEKEKSYEYTTQDPISSKQSKNQKLKVLFEKFEKESVANQWQQQQQQPQNCQAQMETIAGNQKNKQQQDQTKLCLFLIFQDIFEVIPFSKITEFLKNQITTHQNKKYLFQYVNMSMNYQQLWKENLENYLYNIFNENNNLVNYQFEENLQANVEVLRLFFEESFLKQNIYNNCLNRLIQVTFLGSIDSKEGIQIFLEERIKEIDFFNENLSLFLLIEHNNQLSLQDCNEKYLYQLPTHAQRKSKILLNSFSIELANLSDLQGANNSQQYTKDSYQNKSISSQQGHNKSFQIPSQENIFEYNSPKQQLNKSLQISQLQEGRARGKTQILQ